MNLQSILSKMGVWLILLVNVFYTIPSVFMATELFDSRSAFTITNFIFYLAAVALLAQNGTLIRSKLIYLMAISIACIGIGSLFKIMHWSQATEILVFGLCACLCVYLVHFFRKSNYSLLDYMKLIWVLLFVTFSIDMVLHLYFLREWVAVRDLAFLAMLAYYTYVFTIGKTIPSSTD